MPYPSEHAARQAPPGRFAQFRREHPDGFPAGVDVIWGVRITDGKAEPQSIRFDAKRWPVPKAREWLKGHGFLAGELEAATGKADRAPAQWQVGAAPGLAVEDNAEWNEAAAQAGVFAWAGADLAKARGAFLLWDAARPGLQSSYRLPIAAEVAGQLVVNLHGVRAAVSRLPRMEDVPPEVVAQAGELAAEYLGAGGTLTITKVEPDQQVVYGWLYVCADKDGRPVVDHSGETVQISELEKAAVNYALSSRRGGEMHQRMGVGRLVSSVVFTPELKRALGVPAGVLPDGWFVGYKIDDPGTWERVKKGELRMLSIGGRAQRMALRGSEQP